MHLLDDPCLHGFGLEQSAHVTVRVYSRKSPGDPNYATAFLTLAATVYQAIAPENRLLLCIAVQDTSGERIFRRCAAHSADEHLPRPSAVAKLCRRYAAACQPSMLLPLSKEGSCAVFATLFAELSSRPRPSYATIDNL